MSMVSPKLGYKSQGVTAGAQIKTGPAGFYGITSTITGGAVTVYDGTSTGGTILFTKTLTVGEVVTFGGNGIAAGTGLFVVVAAGTVVIIYT